MKLTVEEVRHVAGLARLRLTHDEEVQLTGQLERILGYVDKLGRLDTSKLVPFTHGLDPSELREDKITNRPNPEGLLANAPERDGDFFKVPKIIE